MMGTPKRCRAGVKAGTTIAALVLAITALSAIGARTAAAGTTCRARNATLGTAATSDLQAVLDAARTRDRIEISGVCVGLYTIWFNGLTLVGTPTTDVPRPTLDGNWIPGDGRGVLDIHNYGGRGPTRIQGLTIEHGFAATGSGVGGGINVLNGDLILQQTVVRANRAISSGGGIYYNGGGRLVLNMGTRVVDNRAGGSDQPWGGGISATGTGDVVLNGNALVARNHSAAGAGGIYSFGDVILNAEAVVARNHAAIWGGGIFSRAVVKMNAASSVRDNDAYGQGGGILAYEGVFMNGSSSVRGNSAGNAGGLYAGGPFGLRLSGAAAVTNNVANGYPDDPVPHFGGVQTYPAAYACDATSPRAWVGTLSPNSPNDPPDVVYVPCG